MADTFLGNVEHQSKIVSLKIENFMSIKNALIEFDESNVISLCGYNDSGKSAITRLFEVMLYNAYSTDQVRFITDGEEYWLGELTFSDGVVYTRTKYSDGKSLWELKKGDTVLFTNRLQNGTLAAMGDTPDVIEKYLGVIQDELTEEKLNVRRNTDKLFLINTSGGDNYKILNTVLRSDVFAQASKSLNEDKNKLNAEVNEKGTIKSVLQEQFDSYDVAPKEEIDMVKEFISNLDNVKGKIVRLTMIMEENQRKHEISLYDVLTPVDSERLANLQDILSLGSQKNIPIYDKMNNIDTSRLIDLQSIMELTEKKEQPIYDSMTSIDVNRVKDLQNIMALSSKLSVDTFEKLEPVNVDRCADLQHLGELFTAYAGTQKMFNQLSNQLNDVKGKLKMLSEQYGLKVCHNCGSIVS